MPNEDCTQAPCSWMKRISQRVYGNAKNNENNISEPIKEEECQCHIKKISKHDEREDNGKIEQYNICFTCFNEKLKLKNKPESDYQIATKNNMKARDEIRSRAVLVEGDSFDAELDFDTIQRETSTETLEHQVSYRGNEFYNRKRKVTYDFANSTRKDNDENKANDLIDAMLFPGLKKNIRNVASSDNNVNDNNNKTPIPITTNNTPGNTHNNNDNNKSRLRKKSQQPSEFIREFLGPADTPVNVRLFGGRKGVQYEIERAKSYGYVIHPCSKLRYVLFTLTP